MNPSPGGFERLSIQARVGLSWRCPLLADNAGGTLAVAKQTTAWDATKLRTCEGALGTQAFLRRLPPLPLAMLCTWII